MMYILLLTAVFVTLYTTRAQTYSYDTGSPVQNLLYDDSSRRVFVGGTNQILRLSDDLTAVVASVDTGPVSENAECYYGLCSANGVLADNVNKILLINKGQLIYCGSVLGGRCNASDMLTLKVSTYLSSNNASDAFWTASGKSATYAIASPGLDNNEGMFVAVDEGYKGNSLGAGFPFIASYYINVMKSRIMFQRVPNGWMRMTKASFFHMFSSSPYFYTVGKRIADQNPFISRTCLMDTGQYDKYTTNRYTSYIDIQFRCESTEDGTRIQFQELKLVTTGKLSVNLALAIGGSKGDEVIIAVFYDSATRKHAICPLLVDDLNKKFEEATGQGNSCQHRTRTITSENMELNPVGTLQLDPEKANTDKNLTALKLFNVKDDNILVMGTNKGEIMKRVLRMDEVLQTSTALTGERITKLTASATVLYGLSGTQVFGEPLGRCEGLTTCEACVDNPDPFCGWCLLRASCMQYKECSMSSSSSSTGVGSGFIPELWVNSKVSDTQCFPISGLVPEYARITNATQVTAVSRELVNALRGRDIVCEWVNGTQTLGATDAILSDGGTDSKVMCSTPVLDTSIIAADQDNIKLTVKLRVKSEAVGSTFMTLFDNFPLYYCTNNKQCFDCTRSQFNCKWCKQLNTCLQSIQGCGESGVSLQWFQCPMIKANNYTLEQQGDGELSLDAQNIPTSTQNDYKCVIQTDLEGEIITHATPSQTTEDDQTIQCTVPLNKMTITDKPRSMLIVVTYKSVPILNENDSAIVILYSCKAIKDCSSCKGMDPTYKCTWCTSVNQCMRNIDCETVNQVTKNQCSVPGPQIYSVSPNSGPLEGGTVVTLDGMDLSIKYLDVQNITVAGTRCELIPDGYTVSTRVMCRTRQVSRVFDGPVLFESVNGRATSAESSFSYQQAIISNVEPLTVLKTGGTSVTITGSELDMGSEQKLTLAGNPCDIISRGPVIVCRTRPLAPDAALTGKVYLTIDDARYSTPMTFTYIDVPDVNQVTPTDSIVDGGITITLSAGSGFDYITSAQIFFTDNRISGADKSVSGKAECQAGVADNFMICVTPQLSDPRNIETGRRVNISLVLENTYTKVLEYMPFNIYPNPMINMPEQDTILSAGDSLVIKGKYFDRVKGIEVYLDDQLCENLDVSDKIITCDVPDLLAPDTQNSINMRRRRRQAEEDKDNKDTSTIEKKVNITIRLGSYESDPILATFIQEVPEKGSIMGMVAASAAGGIVVVFLVGAVCLLHRRRLQQKKQFKHIMLQEMERIESRLAEECKQVFTELQTDLADLNSDFSPATIPFHSFDEYALKVLFPAQDDYPVMHEPAEISTYEDSLNVFEKLIKQEQFLLTLVETLDKQRQVSKRDKSNIAALMIVSLMDDMAYITTILRALLSKLITDTVNSDARRIKILFRRSDHIAEKYLSNWLTFNLHSFLVESAGQPLYVLYRAIKQQIEKGPVDYITGNARYALHEKNLLSKITEFHKLNVMVYLEDDPYLKDTPYTPLKSCQVSLLSCDTISQTKAKIIDAMYRTVPDSLKPTPNDVDVEWKNGSSSSLRLVDMLHNTQDGWKQLDTLGTLNIDDQAVFQCIPRQSPPPFMSQSGGAPSCNSLLREIENGRVWHLERDLDCDNDGKAVSGVKTVPEVFLTRLSATKIPLQKFVDDLFNVIFTPNEGITSLPPCVKYLTDFLDSEAARLQVIDPEILHTWKNQALPLRYWISIIKSPDVVFDVRKNNNIDSCLSVIAQTFIDATYYEDMTIDKTSQSSRLLYCKEIPTYKQHVREFYGEIQTCRPVTETDIGAAFAKNHTGTQLRKQSAVFELYNYACRFSEELREALQDKGYRDLADQFLGIADQAGTEHSENQSVRAV